MPNQKTSKNRRQSVRTETKRYIWLIRFSTLFLYLSGMCISLLHLTMGKEPVISALVVMTSLCCIYFVMKDDRRHEKIPLLIMVALLFINEIYFIVMNLGAFDADIILTKLFVPVSFFSRYISIDIYDRRKVR